MPGDYCALWDRPDSYKIATNERPQNQEANSRMAPSFDIFKIDLIGDVIWRDAAESLVAARVSIEKLATSFPGEYLIFDQKTGQRVFVTCRVPLQSLAHRRYLSRL